MYTWQSVDDVNPIVILAKPNPIRSYLARNRAKISRSKITINLIFKCNVSLPSLFGVRYKFPLTLDKPRRHKYIVYGYQKAKQKRNRVEFPDRVQPCAICRPSVR
jgi:hypothetical protein